jgi:transcription elongation factor GreA
MDMVPMTAEGAKLLRDELDHLKRVARPEIIQAISEARAHGDLKENAEYHAAKEQQSFIEGRINEIESKLGQAQVITITDLPNEGKVIFGATVTLINTETDEKIVYQIVGADESDIKKRKISVNSPTARTAIGKYAGDVIEVKTPSGTMEYEIEKVEYI